MQFCAYPGCSVIVPKGRCLPHAVERAHTRPNQEIRKWYYTVPWIHLRQQVLVEACYTCAHCGQIDTALDVDHIVKHEGNPARFWNRANLQALCKSCHSRKTALGS